MSEQKTNIPHTTLRLWVDACRMTLAGDVPLTAEEHEMIPHLMHDIESDAQKEYPLDEPWTIETDDDMYNLVPGLNLSGFCYKHDGEAFIVNVQDEDPTVSWGYDGDAHYFEKRLLPGQEVTSWKTVDTGTAIYRVTLHVAWPA